MAQHDSIPSLLRESVTEYLVVADFCINYRKDSNVWGYGGCFGYPAALLLLSITDAIGTYVLDGTVKNHFNILNHKDYYNLNLSTKDLELIYTDHRCLLAHNAALSLKVGLSIGDGEVDVVKYKDSTMYLNLLPFLELTKKVVGNFLGNVDKITADSEIIKKILK